MEELIAHQINHLHPKLIKYGATYVCRDRIKIGNKDKVRIIFESKNSPHPQGVVLTTDKSIALENGEKSKSWAFWWDGPNRYIDAECITKKGELHVHNTWRDEQGFDVVYLGGAAMRVEDLDDGSRRYYCNDGDLDNDFDDLVFRIQLLDGKKIKSLL